MKNLFKFFISVILITAFNCNKTNNTSFESENNPQSVVKSFIEDLGKKDFQSAYNKTRVEKWGTFENFSSNKAFGGINATLINEIKQKPDENNNAIVYVDAYYYDPINGDNQFKEKFYLRQFGGDWKIIDLKIVDSGKTQKNNSNIKKQNDSEDVHSSPENLVNAIFEAARTNNLEILIGLSDINCDAEIRAVCGMYLLDGESQSLFCEYYKDGYISGETIENIDGNPNRVAVPIKFGINASNNESVVCVKRKSKWYLSSF